jgi:hypothetical protein
MNDDGNRLLREILDATLRHAKSQWRFSVLIAATCVLILAVLGFLVVRLEIRMRQVEKTERDTMNNPAASSDGPPGPP